MNPLSKETYIFIGRSGCGKGTQSKLLIDYLNKLEVGTSQPRSVLYMETGERFRTFIAGSSYSSALSKTLMEKSERQPAFLAVWTWADILVDAMTGNEILVFDGTPRSLVEAEALDTAMDFYGIDKRYVIHLDVSRDWSERHLLSRGRDDDNKEDILKRLDWFDRDVLPAVEFYRNHNNYQVLDINGEQGIELVAGDIIKHFKR